MGMDPLTIGLIAGGVGSVGAAAIDNRSQKKAIQSAEEQKALSQAFIEEQMRQARNDLFKLFPSIQESQNQGLQAGMGVYKSAFPVQVNAFREGNMAAQQHLINAQPQIMNAILGKPVTYGQGLSPVQIDGGVGGLRMPTAPQFIPIDGQPPAGTGAQ